MTPALLLRAGHHGGLGIARSLGRMGVPVYVADSARWEPAYCSRYCRGRFAVDIENGDAVGRVLAVGRRLGRQTPGGRPLLIPTTDTAAIWTAEHAAALQEEFRFPFVDAALVQTLCDKGRMRKLAMRSGVPTAQSVVPRRRQDLDHFVEASGLPVIVKATDAVRLRRQAGGTKFIVETREELLDFYDKADPRQPGFLVQEFIPGEDWMFDGYFNRDSECLFGVTGKKIRRFPVNTGVTSLGVCMHNETVHRTTTEFMKTIGYRGILDIGYRYDRRDGRYKVLDVNPRIGCTFRLFAATNGLDVARALYQDMTGQPVGVAPVHQGRRWIVEDFDLFSALRSLLDGTLSVKEWAKSLRGIHETACFAADDPLPFLLMGAADCCEVWRWMRFRREARASQSRECGDPSLELGA